MSATLHTSSSFRLWSDRIDGGAITRYQCGQWAHAIAPLPYGYMAGGKHTNLTREEAKRLVDQLDALPNGLALTADHEEAGRVWMRKYGLRVGLPIEPQHPTPAGFTTAAVDHFALVGAHCYREANYVEWFGGYGRGLFAPIYRAFLADGRVFDYAPTPWQSSAYGQGKLPLWWRMVSPGAEGPEVVR